MTSSKVERRRRTRVLQTEQPPPDLVQTEQPPAGLLQTEQPPADGAAANGADFERSRPADDLELSPLGS